MKSLVVLLDRDAPSFCYYSSPRSAEKTSQTPRRIERALFQRAVEFAQQHELWLQLICGDEGLPAFALPLLEGL